MPVSALAEPLSGCRFTRSSSWVALSPMRRESWRSRPSGPDPYPSQIMTPGNVATSDGGT